jgi:hypothetical protein
MTSACVGMAAELIAVFNGLRQPRLLRRSKKNDQDGQGKNMQKPSKCKENAEWV